MSQSDQIPTTQVPAGPRTGPQDEGGKGPHITITVQGLQPADGIVSPSLQTPATPLSEDTDDGDINLDGGKGPH